MVYLFDAVPGPVRWIAKDRQRQFWAENKISWISGKRFSDNIIPDPLEFTFQPIKNTWDHGEHLPDFLKGADMPLLHNDVVEAMIRVGIENIDYYPTRITYPENKKVCTSYKAINIINFIDSECVEKSKIETPDNTTSTGSFVNKLDLDDVNLNNRLIYRLPESATNAILVHDIVKKYFENNDIDNIEFHELDTVSLI